MFCIALCALPALAQGVSPEPPMPRPRPADRAPPAVTEQVPPAVTEQAPLPAPEALDVPAVAAETPELPATPAPPAEPEPPKVYAPHQTACPAVVAGLVEAEALPPISEGACVIGSPLNVTGVRVNGRMVPLSSPATLSCATATQLPIWAAQVDGYLFAREDTTLAAIQSGTSYACRNINNSADGDLSAHAFGDALDVTGFTLEDGRTVALPAGWTDPLSAEGRLLRFAHDSACGIFMTTLGPEANAQHADHLHVDMECHGARCVARLCE